MILLPLKFLRLLYLHVIKPEARVPLCGMWWLLIVISCSYTLLVYILITLIWSVPLLLLLYRILLKLVCPAIDLTLILLHIIFNLVAVTPVSVVTDVLTLSVTDVLLLTRVGNHVFLVGVVVIEHFLFLLGYLLIEPSWLFKFLEKASISRLRSILGLTCELGQVQLLIIK